MSNVKQVFHISGNRYYLDNPSVEADILENKVYNLNMDGLGRFYLSLVSDNFEFDYKIYGLEDKLIKRVCKTYNNTTRNLGVLLNGLKGTGKTVTAKLISNSLEQPVIIVDKHLDGTHNFLNSIPQNITVFIDEYEKIFGDSSDMLTIMDGAMNSSYRRLFLLTTNQLYVDDNLIQRPGRIRYLKKFGDLTPEIVSEIVDDFLIHKQFRNECIEFASTLQCITVDIVKSVVQEVNIHEESPTEFQDVFNVQKVTGKYSINLKTGDKYSKFIESTRNIYPRPDYKDGNIGDTFQIDGVYIGRIVKVINFNTVNVEPYSNSKGAYIGFDGIQTFKVENAITYNYSYAYSEDFQGFGDSGKPTVDGAAVLDYIRNYDENAGKTKKSKSKPLERVIEDAEFE
jgi:hypothetical protein